jgi:hypothetical protein
MTLRNHETQMFYKFEWPQPEHELDKAIIRNVREHGCHIVGISADKKGPGYAFSIGLFANYGQAEVVIFGFEGRDAARIINIVRDLAAAGRKFVAGDVCDDILIDHKVSFVEVPLEAYRDYLGTAIWFYFKSPRPFPCLQIVWPDREGRFPWQSDYDASFKELQPLLKSIS